MIFEVLDAKNDCGGYYYNSTINKALPKENGETWTFHDSMRGRGDILASAFISAENPSNACPKELYKSWTVNNNRFAAFHNAFKNSKINMNEFCVWDLIPETFIEEFFYYKSEITKHVLANTPKPEDYDTLSTNISVCKTIEGGLALNLDKQVLMPYLGDTKARKLIEIISKEQNRVIYDPFSVVTGRLTVGSNSFPILNLKKEYRSIITPCNDLFVELDFNAAEIRTILGLAGMEQPDGDIHGYLANEIFHSNREEAKERIFAWLYNPSRTDSRLDSWISRKQILDGRFACDKVITPFKRTIPADEFHALNYLIQSSSSDNTLDRVNEIMNILVGRRSFVSFVVHDSVVIDMSREDLKLIKPILNTFSETRLGKFVVNVSGGPNYGALSKIEI